MYMHVWIVCLWTIEFSEAIYVYKWIIYGVQSVYYKDVKSEMRSRLGILATVSSTSGKR